MAKTNIFVMHMNLNLLFTTDCFWLSKWNLKFSHICHKTCEGPLRETEFLRHQEAKDKAIPVQAPRDPEGLGSQISRQSVHEGGKVVSSTHLPPLPTGNITGTRLC